ncbi:hypothetical protein AMTR_s00023p00245340 [Amborella trichopoda]|uniref:Uncharacterized protein n=1 Tax=Amborella trichopoda TaxID=13333 RepID=W1NJX8_AMBTC|nr:hypothetical protein AMTR_s00023p00245340 [Amborella trichopoda]
MTPSPTPDTYHQVSSEKAATSKPTLLIQVRGDSTMMKDEAPSPRSDSDPKAVSLVQCRGSYIEKKRAEVRAKAEEMLRAMHVSFSGEVRIVEVAIV